MGWRCFRGYCDTKMAQADILIMIGQKEILTFVAFPGNLYQKKLKKMPIKRIDLAYEDVIVLLS